MSAQGFTDYPIDLLLEIIIRLETEDIIAFLSVCSSFQKLSESRFLWITVLERTQCRRRLACPVGCDITQASIEELRRIATLTHRLEMNWNSSSPRILRSVKVKRYAFKEEPGNILLVIPSTSIVIIYTRETRKLICCDLDDAEPPASLHLGGGIRMHAYDNIVGKNVLAMIINPDPPEEECNVLHVVAIEYGQGKRTTVQEIYHADIDYPCREIFMCGNLVGIIPSKGNASMLLIHTINFATGVRKDVCVDIGYPISHRAFVFCFVHEKSPVYILVSDRTRHEVYRLALPFDSPSQPDDDDDDDDDDKNNNISSSSLKKLTLLAKVQAADDPTVSETTAALQFSKSGLVAAYVQDGGEWSQNTSTRICFWPSMPGSMKCTDELSADLILPGKVGEYDPRDPESQWLTTIGTAHAIMILDSAGGVPVEETKETTTLHVVHFARDSRSLHSRKLELPFFINLPDIYSVGMDEPFGVVYLSHRSGYLFALPYA